MVQISLLILRKSNKKMKEKIYLLFFVLIFLSCNESKVNQEKALFPITCKQSYFDNFVKTYKDHIESLGDTSNIYVLFVDTKFKISKFYLMSVKSTYLIEDNFPLTYFKVDESFVFVYTGLEKNFLVNSLNKEEFRDIVNGIKNSNPVVYNPKIWCLKVSNDSTFIDKNPSSEEIIEGTNILLESKKIKFIPPH